MTRWNHEKRQVHPHGLLPALDRLFKHASFHKTPVRRARAAARSKSPALRGSMTRTKM
jgi:hypothetical protein